MLFVIVLSPLAAVCQSSRSALPEAPAPAADAAGTQSAPQAPAQAPPANPQISDREWRRIQNILHDERVVVASTYGPPLHCRFASATDTALYCDAPGSPDGTGFRFERATVIFVELETPQPRPNHHPAWISCMLAGGILVGLAVSENADAGHAAAVGVISAAVVGAIGAPLAFMDRDNGPPQPVIYGSRALVSVPIGRLRLPRGLLLIHR